MSAKKKTPKQYKVSAEDFVIAWNTSGSVQEVARKLNKGKPKNEHMSIDIIHARASKYRKAGVNLKDHAVRSGRSLDVDKLNALIEDLEKEKGGSKRTSSDAADENVVDAVVKKVLERLGNQNE